jgi:two-component system sensor histidine kinase YesM
MNPFIHIGELYKHLIYRTKLRNKLILSYVMLFGIWAAYFTFDSYEKSVGILQDQFKLSMLETLEQVQLHLSYRFEEMAHISNLILNNAEIQQTLQNDRFRNNPLKQLEDYYLLRSYLSELIITYSKYQIEIYLPYKTIYTSEQLNFNTTDEIKDEDWYRQVAEGKVWSVWHGPSHSYGQMTESLSLIKRMFTFQSDAGSEAAILKIDINEHDVTEQLAKITAEKQGTMDLVDAKGIVITSNVEDRKGLVLHHDIWERIDKLSSSGIFESGDGKMENIVAFRQVDYHPDWYIVTTSPKSNITKSTANMRNFNFFVLILLLTLSIALVAFSTKAITRRIHTLGMRMSSLDHNRFDDLIHIQYHDELSKIERKYNDMSIRLRHLIEEVYRVEGKKKEAELKALQAQINPHFLYNTLDTISWMAVDKGEFDISKMTTTLGKFFRLSLSKGNDIITLREELEITKLYLHIQQVRFSNRLDIRYDVDEALLDYPVVKLILQPIVENAIKHGIQNNKDKRGMIVIEGRKAEDRVRIRIIDDGSEPEREGYDHADPLDRSGYGLDNVLERLVLHFRDNCLLDLNKRKVGAVVTIEWPALEDKYNQS